MNSHFHISSGFGEERPRVAIARALSRDLSAEKPLAAIDPQARMMQTRRCIKGAALMLKISDISYFVEGRPLFESTSAVIPTGHKVGLVGRNGAGKTTLFKLIKGELTLDSGLIEIPKGARIGGVSQEVPGNEVSLLDTVIAADTERADLMAESETATDPHRIGEIQTRLADIDAWSAEARASNILRGLGFTDEEQRMPCSAFSGGWRMRVALAGVLFSAPDLLLLDEPTNYLDLEGALWLEAYLVKYPHTVLIVSHDRELLNRSVNGILHLDERKLTYWSGPYDQFVRQRAEQRAVQTAAAKKQDARRAHLQKFVDRFRAKASKAKQAQSRIKLLEKMETIRSPEEAAATVFSFPEPEELSPPIIATEGVSVGYGDHIVLRNLNLRIDQDDRIALLGRNGEGKSTLSKLLSDRLPAIGGKIARSNKLRIGFFAQHQVDELFIDETPIQHLQRVRPGEHQSRLRARLAGFGLMADQAETLVGKLSGGQKARLSLLLATIDAPHLLILDEPTNHLDIESREALVEALTAYSGAVILVSHDMHLLSMVADRLWLVKGGAVRPYDEDLDAYRRLLLEGEKPAAPKAEAPKVKKATREEISGLQTELRKCEDRLTKINDMRDKLAKKLADPELYEDDRKGDLAVWNRKYAEVMDALARAEDLWMAASEKLEAARSRA
ncbi:putative ABC transporter, fused ATPase subunits [Ketogulonicigenium vulgare Y25]|uniref:ABC transporter, ATPase subunit n=2 Tax=Ketogulonicigenium vulgare TaxID=92945 RepID=F9Y6V1_KETVW|nr:putative ABC transporter, fused ATPase subunits [Ketogulonicigenium vulgare Y25]AEM40968.1 ABC transporter, ATPase subunit [Ketogulonicigenium vulgare WSH-001]ALJ81119.1 glycosyl transferase family 1 [Ketogulonicigenium vulgare]ANW33869.1 glycosyl transferase family 1 [Ketogulonicigenium vulgare]